MQSSTVSTGPVYADDPTSSIDQTGQSPESIIDNNNDHYRSVPGNLYLQNMSMEAHSVDKTRKVGRPTKAETLATSRDRSNSEGNIRELLKRKRTDLEQGLMDKIMSQSPFKKSNLTSHSPEKQRPDEEETDMAKQKDVLQSKNKLARKTRVQFRQACKRQDEGSRLVALRSDGSEFQSKD